VPIVVVNEPGQEANAEAAVRGSRRSDTREHQRETESDSLHVFLLLGFEARGLSRQPVKTAWRTRQSFETSRLRRPRALRRDVTQSCGRRRVRMHALARLMKGNARFVRGES
jgi:hypothetical protein